MLDAKKEQAVISFVMLIGRSHGGSCVLGNNRIAGLFIVLFISNACHHLLQQPKPSILSFIAYSVQAENCTVISIIINNNNDNTSNKFFKFITKCDKCYYKVRQLFLLQSAMVCYYKVRQLFYYKVRQVLLQSATGITKCDNFITKCDRYFKVRRLLQSATVCQTLGDKPTIHIVCCEDDFFPKGKFKLFNGLSHSMYLASPKSLFSIANLFAVRYLWDVWDVCNEDKCCVATQRATDLLGCLEMCYY